MEKSSMAKHIWRENDKYYTLWDKVRECLQKIKKIKETVHIKISGEMSDQDRIQLVEFYNSPKTMWNRLQWKVSHFGGESREFWGLARKIFLH